MKGVALRADTSKALCLGISPVARNMHHDLTTRFSGRYQVRDDFPEDLMDTSDLEFELPLEEEAETLDLRPEGRAVYTAPADAEIESLYLKYKRGKLVVQPDFQFDYVWDLKRASRLIESAMLAIPIPIVYLSEEPDNKEYVIDGQQRLTSFFSFLSGSFANGEKFRLSGLQVFSEINGKTFDELDESLQDTIRYFKLRTVTFLRGSDENLKFEIFERLNTGSVPLNDQELRNCIYRGPYNDLIHALSRDPDFLYILDTERPDKRRRDVELVLRFCAFYHSTYLKYKPPMKTFLNKEASTRQNMSEEERKVTKAAFKNACQIARSMFGKNAFKRFYPGTEKNPNGAWESKKFNASLFDVVMYTFAGLDKNIAHANLDSIREALIYLMTENKEFIDAIELSTSSTQAVSKRFDLWRAALQDVIGQTGKEARCFTRALKEELFLSNKTCAICGQRIDHVDDAAVDHVEQYWTGGKTIPENARLTHRYCNWSRPRND
jgi:hypothetical protein